MGKGGNASAAGPAALGKGLSPDRQYTQIRGQVRFASASPSIERDDRSGLRFRGAGRTIQSKNEDVYDVDRR